MALLNAKISQFNCEFCKFSAYSKSNVSKHLQIIHYCSISYSCMLCDFFCGLREIFSLHLQSHHASFVDAVDDIDRDFGVNNQRKQTSWHHNKLLTSKSITTNAHQIEKCVKPLKSRQRQRQLRSSLSKSLGCAQVQQKGSSSDKLYPRKAQTNCNGKAIIVPMHNCVECNMKFKYFSALKSHLKTHLTGRTLKSSKINPVNYTAQLRKVSKTKANKKRTIKDTSTVKGMETLVSFGKFKEKSKLKKQRKIKSPTKGFDVCNGGGEDSNMHGLVNNNVKPKTIKHISQDEVNQDKEELSKSSHYTDSEMMFLKVAKGIDRKATEFPCPHCSYVGKVFRNFKEHVMGHSEQKPFVCSSCCRSFVCKSKLVRHQRQVHNEERPFLCSECPYTAKSRSCLETHRLVMHPLEEHLRFSCPQCPARFARASMLKTHALTHNTGPHKLFSCPQCSFTTNYRRQFELHTTLHTGKHCLCFLCGRAYSGQAQLKVHMKVHHSDQKFQCSLCNFITKRPEGLNKHMKSHSTERPYPCPYCEYKGKRKAHLTRHLTRHENSNKNLTEMVKIYCPSCSKMFKSKDKLANHLNSFGCSSKANNTSENKSSTSFQLNTPRVISTASANIMHHNLHLGQTQMSHQSNCQQGSGNPSTATPMINTDHLTPISSISNSNLPKPAPSLVYHPQASTTNLLTQPVSNQYPEMTLSELRPIRSSNNTFTTPANIFTIASENTHLQSPTFARPTAKTADSEAAFVSTPSVIHQESSMTLSITSHCLSRQAPESISSSISLQNPYTYTPTSASLFTPGLSHPVIASEMRNHHQSILTSESVESSSSNHQFSVAVHSNPPISSAHTYDHRFSTLSSEPTTLSLLNVHVNQQNKHPS